jgi:hypothetical protein
MPDCFGTTGDCGLSDGSVAGDWRLPNLRELYSLIDFSQDTPALPDGYPFTDVEPSGTYRSSSTRASNTVWAWCVNLEEGRVDLPWIKAQANAYVWPVRGESAPCPSCATGGATEPFKPMTLFGPWLLLAAAVASGAITAVALKRRAA